MNHRRYKCEYKMMFGYITSYINASDPTTAYHCVEIVV
jgi:hypothetical protein